MAVTELEIKWKSYCVGLLQDHGEALELSTNGSVGETSGITTEYAPVPSSDHVAYIVGHKGCKIRALRVKTGTYIKTPIRGEEPIFIIAGEKEHVAAAKSEILKAAEHFTKIRSRRQNHNNGFMMSEQTIIQVPVSSSLVEEVMGFNGIIIKRIQEQTGTHIVLSNRNNEPVFEIMGRPDNAQCARKEIEFRIMVEADIERQAANISATWNDSSLEKFEKLFQTYELLW